MDFSLPDRERFEKIWSRVSLSKAAPSRECSAAELAAAVFRDEKLYSRAALTYRRQARLFRHIAEQKSRQLAELQLMHFLASGDTAGISCVKDLQAMPPSIMFLRERCSAENSLAERFELAAKTAGTEKERSLFVRLARQTRGFEDILARQIALFMR